MEPPAAETREGPKEEEKIAGDGIKGGKPLEDNDGDVSDGTVVGETLGDAAIYYGCCTKRSKR